MKKLVLVFAVISLGFASCKKEELKPENPVLTQQEIQKMAKDKKVM